MRVSESQWGSSCAAARRYVFVSEVVWACKLFVLGMCCLILAALCVCVLQSHAWKCYQSLTRDLWEYDKLHFPLVEVQLLGNPLQQSLSV